MFTIHTFWLPKAGSTDAEYEDAYAIVSVPDAAGRMMLRAAVADGATEASFSGAWARVLVAAFVRTEAFDLGALPVLTAEWETAVTAQTAAKTLSWYAEEKLQYGSFAALVGIVLLPDGTWRADAAGDSCVLHIRGSKLLKAFPIERAADFDNRPALIATQSGRNAGVTVQTCVGEWRKGDQLFLLSDALAQFVLGHPESIGKLTKLKPDAFAAMIERLRADKLCRNDDVTFVRVRADAAPHTVASTPSDET
ncbi:MAG: protein phosphatase 2C domain-containing protein [Chloroflexota bacterium]|nr:protein phosphatase 2C domain-containing protein [Chloroflexota bacterium]